MRPFPNCLRRRSRHAPDLPDELEPASLVLPRVAVPGVEVQVPVEAEADVVPAAWSDAELLRDKDFADYTDAERRLARQRDAPDRRRGTDPAHQAHPALAPARRPAARRAARPQADDSRVAPNRRRPR